MGEPIRDGDCLCNRPAGINYLEVNGQRVGLSGLESLFKRWQQSGWEPDKLSSAEILHGLRETNYVNEKVAVAYVEAARIAYFRWRSRIGEGVPNAQG